MTALLSKSPTQQYVCIFRTESSPVVTSRKVDGVFVRCSTRGGSRVSVVKVRVCVLFAPSCLHSVAYKK